MPKPSRNSKNLTITTKNIGKKMTNVKKISDKQIEINIKELLRKYPEANETQLNHYGLKVHRLF